MTITRRNVLTASAALATLLAGRVRLHAAPLPRDVDVLVIGAGAAGIAAARRIAAAKRRVMIVEAMDRSGGRCLTDTATFGVPFDRGARWLYQPDANAVARLARSVSADLMPVSSARLRIGRRNARAGETEDFLAALVRANRAIAEGGHGRADIAAAGALPKDLGDWAGTLEFMLGPAATSKDLSEVSLADLARAEPRDTMAICRQGLGTFVVKLGEAIPVALSTPATRIEWGGRGLAVETPAGRVAARAVIVTASTAVLTSGTIKFAPELPKRQLDAAAKLGLGHYDHTVLELAGNPLNLQRDDMVMEQSDSTRTATLVANMSASSLCAIDVGGSFGRDLAAQGEAAMVQFAIEWLEKLYGSDVKAAVRRSTVTRWAAQPYIKGAMSVAAPGAQGARRILMEPLGGGLFFAGEAAHETQWGTVAGAWESGERAADAALARLVPDTAVPEQRQRRKKSRTRSKG